MAYQVQLPSLYAAADPGRECIDEFKGGGRIAEGGLSCCGGAVACAKQTPGCGVREVWGHMKLHDDLLKERLWLELRRREELQFFVLSADSSTAATTASASKAKQRYARTAVPLHLVCTRTWPLFSPGPPSRWCALVWRWVCVPPRGRTDRGIVDVPRTPVDVGSMPRSEAEEQPIRAVASLALRESVLGIHDVRRTHRYRHLSQLYLMPCACAVMCVCVSLVSCVCVSCVCVVCVSCVCVVCVCRVCVSCVCVVCVCRVCVSCVSCVSCVVCVSCVCACVSCVCVVCVCRVCVCVCVWC